MDVPEVVTAYWTHYRLFTSDHRPDEQALGFLGAGPIESLLSFHGRDAVEAVDTAARRSERFRTALRSTWLDDSDIDRLLNDAKIPVDVVARLRSMTSSTTR